MYRTVHSVHKLSCIWKLKWIVVGYWNTSAVEKFYITVANLDLSTLVSSGISKTEFRMKGDNNCDESCAI